MLKALLRSYRSTVSRSLLIIDAAIFRASISLYCHLLPLAGLQARVVYAET